MSRIEYQFIPHHEIEEGILAWRYNKYAQISGPYIITGKSVRPRETSCLKLWVYLLNTKTGQVLECPQQQLRKAVICN